MLLKRKKFLFKEHVHLNNPTPGNFFSFYISVSTEFKSSKKPSFLYERTLDLLPMWILNDFYILLRFFDKKHVFEAL